MATKKAKTKQTEEVGLPSYGDFEPVEEEFSTEEKSENATAKKFGSIAMLTPEPAKESAVDRVIRLREEAEAKKQAPVEEKKEPAPTPVVTKPTPKEKTSRYGMYEVHLVNPDAASPAWTGKRGRAFELVEEYYDAKPTPTTPLTVAEWLRRVVADGKLERVGFDFLRFYEEQGRVTIILPITPAKITTA